MAKVFIAIPTTGNIRIELASFLINIIHYANYQIMIDIANRGGICHNRNLLVKNFLQTNCDYLMFCDSDIVPPMNILEILESGKDVISPINFTWKDGKLVPLLLRKNKQGYEIYNKAIDSNKDLVEVDAVGLGCLLIKRRIFENLNFKKPYFKFIFDENGQIEKGEDFRFCDDIKNMGFKIWVDKKFMTSHFSIINMKEINKEMIKNARLS